METSDREKTLKWLSCSSFETELREFVKNWLPGTCEWINSHQEYMRWEDPSPDAPQALWIFRNLGCGKTFLSHFIRQRLSREGGIVIYFYFNSKQGDSRKQSANVFYRTIIYQLLKALEGTAISTDCYSIAHELRSGTGANNSITNESLVNTLKDMLLRIGTRVTIVIDALDECKEDDQESVERSVSLCHDVHSLKVVITSRPDLNIVDRFKKISSKINTQLGFSKTESGHDIDLYIQRRLQNSKTLSDKMFPAMTQQVGLKLRKSAGGMFLYVKLMLDMLEQQVTEEGIQNGLESLPETLAGIYHNIIHKIEKNACRDLGETAKRVLLWVAAAQRPLTLDGLMMALRAENLKTKENPTISDLGPFIPNYRERLWQICFPLVEVLEDNTVQVIHVSLRQYLLYGNIIGHGPVAPTRGNYHYFQFVSPEEHIELAHTCIAYLSAHKMRLVGSPNTESDGNVNKHEDVRKDFFAYATLEWTRHYQASGGARDFRKLNDRLLKYFGVHDQFKGWIEDRAAFNERFAIYFNLEIDSGGLITGNLPRIIHICAYFGLTELSRVLLDKDGGAIKLEDGTGRTPLHIAAERNWAALLDYYIEKAQNLANRDYGGRRRYTDFKDHGGKTALHRAAARGNRLTVISLLKAGFSPNSPDDLGQTPLFLGALSGERDSVLELCNAGGSLDFASKSGLTPLDCLITHGHEEALKGLLLSGRLPEDLPKSASLAFITAARKGFNRAVDLLLHAKINVNARDDINQTALHRAATWGHTEVVELLLRQKWRANVDAVDQSQRTPLYFAAAGGHITIVKCLIQAGADVNVLDRHSQTVLFEPAGRGHTAVVKELLGSGVRAEEVDHRERSALHWASRNGCKEVVELLLNAGADLHREELKKETPLHWAAQNGQDMMVEQLINAGAEPEARDEQGRTPLHHGAWRGMQASVYALLGRASSPDIVDHNGRTPLYWGVVSGDLGVVQTLLDAKANITAGDTQKVTPLHIAAQYGNNDILRRFLDTGPNLEARDNKNKTPLHFAAQEGKHNAIRLLLDAGASPLAIDFKWRTPTFNQSKKNDESDGMTSELNKAKEDAELEYLSRLPSLHQAARKGDHPTVKNLIAAGTSINEKDDRGRLALHWAALGGHESIFLWLVSVAGANIQFSDDLGQTALHLAVENRHPEIVKQCLLAGADAMIKDTCGRTALHLAVKKGHEGIITQLLELPGPPECVNVADNWSRTPLHFAAESGSNQVLAKLLACGASTINSGDYKGQTPLHRAARKGHRDVVWGLPGAMLHVTDSNKRTALHLAAKHGHTNMVQQFIYEQDIIDARDKDNRTALHLAAEKGYSTVVEHLLYAEDIYINASDKDNRTALDLAAENGLNSTPEVDAKDIRYIRPQQRMAEKGPASVVKRLLDAGAAVGTHDNLKRTSLHLAAQNGHKEIVDVLVDSEAMVDVRDYWQKTPLHWASKNGNSTIVQRLLSAGANARVAGDAHDTPLHAAAENSHDEIVKLLIDAGADPDATLYKTRETPLHMAAKNGNVVAMKYLLDSYPDVRVLDASQETPLHYAAREGRVNAAKLLLEYGADTEAQNAEGKTPADIAKLSQQTKMMELFVRFDS